MEETENAYAVKMNFKYTFPSGIENIKASLSNFIYMAGFCVTTVEVAKWTVKSNPEDFTVSPLRLMSL